MVFLDAPGNAPAEVLRYADEIEGDDDLLFAGLIFENKSLGEKIMDLSFSRFVPSRIARHPDIFFRSHDDGGEARLPLHRHVVSNGDGFGGLGLDEDEAG